MTIEDNLEIIETLFHRAVKKNHKNNVDFFYNVYVDYITQNQEYIWYKGLDTKVNFVKEVYDEYRENNKL